MGMRTPRPEEENKPRDVLARKRRDVSFCKRRKTLFSKALKLCIEHDARIAVLVLSPAGKPCAFGHSSVDAVLNHYFNVQQEQPTTSVVKYEEHIMVESLECMKEGIENEVRACQTAQDIASLRERLRELSKKINERLKNSSSSEYVFKAMSEEDRIGYESRYLSGRSSGSHMVSPNFMFKPPCPLPKFSTHAPSLINGGLSNGYVLDYGNNYRPSWGGKEYVENIMPSYLSQSSGSNMLSPNFFNNSPCPLPNISTHVPSLDSCRLSSPDDHVYGTNINCGEGSYEVLGNIGLGHDDPDNDNSYLWATIYLPRISSSSNPLSPGSLFPNCSSPANISSDDNYDHDDDGLRLDVSSPRAGAMVCPSTNGAFFDALIGS